MANKHSKLPTDLSQHTFTAYLEYGLLDSLALDARLGYAFSDLATDPMLSPKASLDGMTDTNLGIRWRALDETIGDPMTVTFRVAGVIEGSYRAGALNAIGDGASGGEFSMLVGRIFDNGLSVYNEVGYRTRNRPVPDEFFASIGGRYGFASGFSAGVSYQIAESLGGIDIGSPGFTPSRFPAVNEDYQIVGFDLSYQLAPRTFVSVNYGKTVDGRNTGDQDIVGLSIGQGFF
ncbi:MAG: transporter [Gammaproteobacteria bacterium]